jgi:hypothetical protein
LEGWQSLNRSGDTALEPAQSQLEDAQFAFRAWVDLAAGGFTLDQDVFA